MSTNDCYNLHMKENSESDKKKVGAEDDESSSSAEEDSLAGHNVEDSESPADEEIIRPYRNKIGEAAGNLRQREKWFQKRTGSRK